jgi:hypothetical protein
MAHLGVVTFRVGSDDGKCVSERSGHNDTGIWRAYSVAESLWWRLENASALRDLPDPLQASTAVAPTNPAFGEWRVGWRDACECLHVCVDLAQQTPGIVNVHAIQPTP